MCRQRGEAGYSVSDLANNGPVRLRSKGNLWHLYSYEEQEATLGRV